MTFQLILCLSLLLGQANDVTFTIENTKEEPVYLRVPGFDTVVLAPESESSYNLIVGEKVYAILEEGPMMKKELIILEIEQDHQDEVFNVHKLIKKAERSR